MTNRKTKIILFCIIFILVIGLLYLVYSLSEKNKEKGEEYLKNYKVNEYISTYISEEDMAGIYLNDFIQNMFSDVENSYYLLDEEYRNKKFRNMDDYKNYVNSLNYPTYNLTKYYKRSKDGYIYFGVYDQNGNIFIFKTKGVMQYTVFLDDYTVGIW